MDKIKCNIEIELDRGLFYAISALSGLPLSDDTLDAIMKKDSYSISISDLEIPNDQRNALSLAMAAILLGKQLEKEEKKKGGK
ncbi:hypothetical protein [Prevotella histicola]|uniref:Uncharacterized protein n=1 Tax=Prevotella histicola JCM 15637 = DNF00424 TaxID=1236504 RepID=A0AAW3FCU5_9BACT|nr:hypothetical protein [Prevotella histicola]KGF24839.1 hypothetical protein HMPREF2132_11110 [Prevotella histicola JCM 15637 = DNF00424]